MWLSQYSCLHDCAGILTVQMEGIDSPSQPWTYQFTGESLLLHIWLQQKEEKSDQVAGVCVCVWQHPLCLCSNTNCCGGGSLILQGWAEVQRQGWNGRTSSMTITEGADYDSGPKAMANSSLSPQPEEVFSPDVTIPRGSWGKGRGMKRVKGKGRCSQKPGLCRIQKWRLDQG